MEPSFEIRKVFYLSDYQWEKENICHFRLSFVDVTSYNFKIISTALGYESKYQYICLSNKYLLKFIFLSCYALVTN